MRFCVAIVILFSACNPRTGREYLNWPALIKFRGYPINLIKIVPEHKRLTSPEQISITVSWSTHYTIREWITFADSSAPDTARDILRHTIARFQAGNRKIASAPDNATPGILSGVQTSHDVANPAIQHAASLLKQRDQARVQGIATISGINSKADA